MTRQYNGDDIDLSACPSNLGCVDHYLPTESEALSHVSEWKWKKYHSCSLSDYIAGNHTACGHNGYCCHNIGNSCPVGALEPIRDFDHGTVRFTFIFKYDQVWVKTRMNSERTFIFQNHSRVILLSPLIYSIFGPE